MADETTDVSQKEQMTLVIRYVDKDLVVREDFLGFVQITDLTGRALADMILGCLERMHIDCSYLVGQGYDGAAAMSGIYNRVQAVVKEKCPLATYVHCASHCLNLKLEMHRVFCLRLSTS